jgi:hypothetical protein
VLSLSLLEAGAAIDLLLLLLPLLHPNDLLLVFFCLLVQAFCPIEPYPCSLLVFEITLISRSLAADSTATRRKPAAGVAYGPRTHRKDSKTKEEVPMHSLL